MKLKYIIYLLLIICNVVSLYMIIDLSNYDEMIGYLENGSEKFDNPRQTAIVFLFTCIINLLFISANFMRSVLFPAQA
jgi:hypothetical protein